MNASVIDLFCGVGGLSHGFRREKFPVAAGIDVDARCKYAFETNNQSQFLCEDVANIDAARVNSLFGESEIRILAGCAPCQDFSLYRNGKPRGAKWRLVEAFGRLAVDVSPEIITMENVPQLRHYDVFDRFVATLEANDYWVTWYLARGPEYGIPQSRTRLVLFASKLGTIELVRPTHGSDNLPTVRKAIANLEPLVAGGKSARDPLHRCRNLSSLNLRRIQATPAGGWWRDWDEELRLRCHQMSGGSSYRSVYGRMQWDRPSPTITTQCIGIGNGQFGHPEQDRAISLREAAILQSFPRSYRFTPPRGAIPMQTVALQIGNAVPVRLGQMVARSIRRHLNVCGAM